MTDLPPPAPGSRVRVALVNDFEIIVRGLEHLLAPHTAELEIVELSAGGGVDTPVDVALFDTYGHRKLGLDRIAELVADPEVRRVAVFSAAVAPHLVEQALAAGATAFLPKSLSGAELAAALVRVAAGERVVVGHRTGRPTRTAEPGWPGGGHGLTERESELLSLVARGMRNEEIADALYVSLNTVKSHLKSAFRKLGARNRAEAVATIALDPTFRVRAALGGPGSAAAG